MAADTDKRERLIDAARHVMVKRGLAGATTREIAQHAGVAEGTIYNYFEDKVDLCLAVVWERFPVAVMAERLDELAGSGNTRQVLVTFVEDCLQLFHETIPMFSGIIGTPDLAELHRKTQPEGKGPLQLTRSLIAYLAAEQAAGHIGSQADPVIVAHMLIGTAFHHVHLKLSLGEERMLISSSDIVRGIVDTTLGACGSVRNVRS